jgi:hypothetical protein
MIHPIIKDAEMVRFGILLLCQERSIVILITMLFVTAPRIVI